MLKLSQTQFEEPGDIKSTQDEPLIVHQRAENTNDQIVVFVHGLGGSRYGENATWGKFPAFIFEDLPLVDVGIYQYGQKIKVLEIGKS